MGKSAWLLSAGLFAISAPALGQSTTQSTTDTDKGSAQPTQGATAEAAATDDRAQEQQPVDTSDIVVTATRRNQALSDVPLAVSAVTAENLEYSGATDIRQLNQLSPSLLVSSTSSEAGAGVARIRGVGTVGDNPGLESSVGVFIDGVYRSRVGVGLTELGALDRIEVLRGPQGTLFGRNTSAGLISIITAKPRFQNEFSVQGDIGNYDLRRLEGSATGPVASGLAARVDAVYVKRDGFLKDVVSGRSLNDRNRWLVRGQLLYQPDDKLSVRLIGDVSRRREECCGAVYLPASDFTATGAQPSSVARILQGLGAPINDDPSDRETSLTPGRNYDSDVDDWGVSGEVVYDFGAAELTSITAYRFNDWVRGQDADFNKLDIWYRDSGGGAGNRFKTFTQELRLQGDAFGGKLDWLIGGYFANEKLRVLDNLTYGADFRRYANCLTAANLAYAIPGATALLDPSNTNSCMNPLVAGALVANPLIPASTRGAINLLRGGAIPGVYGYQALAAALGMPTFSFAGTGLDDEYNQTSNNWAVFTHNIFSITDQLKVTVGARYTRERKTLSANLTDTNSLCRALQAAAANPNPLVSGLAGLQTLPCVIPSVPGGAFSDRSSKTEGKLSGTAVLSYKLSPELLTYLSYSRGYKAGGFNLDRSAFPRLAIGNPASPAVGGVLPSATLDDLQFEPEINNAFEFGVKYNGRGIDVNLAVFRQLFRDFQLNAYNGINFEVVNINSCSEDLGGTDTDASGTTGACTGKTRSGVKSVGAELEVFTRPLTDVSWNFGAVYAATRYRHNLVGFGGRPISPNFFQLPGRALSNSAEWTVTSSLAWTPPIGGSGLRGLFYVDARYMSEFNTGSDLDIEKTQDGFGVVNGRIGISGPNQAWGVELWAQNLLDKDFMQVAFDAPLQGYGTGTYSNTRRGVVSGRYARSNQLFGAFLGEPRTFGLTLRGKF